MFVIPSLVFQPLYVVILMRIACFLDKEQVLLLVITNINNEDQCLYEYMHLFLSEAQTLYYIKVVTLTFNI
jgi:hypothetical protein